VDYLYQNLVAEGLRLARSHRGLRVLSVGCGPAIEVQRFLADRSLAAQASFELLDFNDETLQHTRQAVSAAAHKHGLEPMLRLTRKSVHQIVKEAARSTQGPASGNYDYIYCAGLFDYLTDPICRRLMEVMFNWLAPGGRLVATNVTPANPIRHGMEHVLDWTLVYRNAQQMALLKPERAGEDFTVRSDVSGVNLWLEVRKPDHA
jgi:extracellular factor (EF) 3-hydroxypalmitic acid methyl ester biosynthesis protein